MQLYTPLERSFRLFLFYCYKMSLWRAIVIPRIRDWMASVRAAWTCMINSFKQTLINLKLFITSLIFWHSEWEQYKGELGPLMTKIWKSHEGKKYFQIFQSVLAAYRYAFHNAQNRLLMTNIFITRVASIYKYNTIIVIVIQ